MIASHKTICLIASGLAGQNLRLQPWRYLFEVTRQLSNRGYRLVALTDGSQDASCCQGWGSVQVQRLPSVSNPFWRSNRRLRSLIHSIAPDLVLWHTGLTSFLHQDFHLGIAASVIGVFTSPLYRPGELLRLGLPRLAQGYRLSAAHLLGSLVHPCMLRSQRENLDRLVVQTETTRRELVGRDLWKGDIEVIPPGVDDCWRPFHQGESSSARAELGYGSQEKVIVFYGSPEPLRGLPTLLHAFEIARRSDPALRLLALSRRRPGEAFGGMNSLEKLLQRETIRPWVKMIAGFLEPAELARIVAASDLVALPFDLLPSDAPLSPLEAQALGKPLVITRVACLPELAQDGPHFLAEPGDPGSLAQALLGAARYLDRQGNSEPGVVPPYAPRARRWEQVGDDWAQLIQRL